MSEISSWVVRSAASAERRVRIVEGCLVRHDENVRYGAELLRHGCDKVITHQNILVLFLGEFITWRRHNFYHVFARQKDRGWNRVSIGRRYVEKSALRVSSGIKTTAVDRRELVHTIVRCRLHLVEYAHAVIASELRIVWHRRIVGIQVVRSAIQCEGQEWIVRSLPGAIHIGYRIASNGVNYRVSKHIETEPLGPGIPTGS